MGLFGSKAPKLSVNQFSIVLCEGLSFNNAQTSRDFEAYFKNWGENATAGMFEWTQLEAFLNWHVIARPWFLERENRFVLETLNAFRDRMFDLLSRYFFHYMQPQQILEEMVKHADAYEAAVEEAWHEERLAVLRGETTSSEMGRAFPKIEAVFAGFMPNGDLPTREQRYDAVKKAFDKTLIIATQTAAYMSTVKLVRY